MSVNAAFQKCLTGLDVPGGGRAKQRLDKGIVIMLVLFMYM